MSALNTAPLYVQFANQIRAEIAAQGLPPAETSPTPSGFPENENYFFVEWGAHGLAPALIVPKSKTRMGNIHSHVDLVSAQVPGAIPLPKKNGRVVCHLSPDMTSVSKALRLFVGASKRPVAAPVRRLSGVSAPALQDARHVTPALTLPEGPSEYDAPKLRGPGSYSDQDAEEALAALGLE